MLPLCSSAPYAHDNMGPTLNNWTVMYAVSIFVFSLGVGGEYPIKSTTSMEKYAGKADRLHRGRSVCLAFLMQGRGQLANQLALLALLYAFNESLAPPYSNLSTQATFRISFVFVGFSIAYFLYCVSTSSRTSTRRTQTRQLDTTSEP